MLVQRAAGVLSVAGAVVALIMGVWLVGVNLAVEVLDPLRGLSAGLSALAAAVVGMLGCLLFFRRHITGGLVLMTAAAMLGLESQRHLTAGARQCAHQVHPFR